MFRVVSDRKIRVALVGCGRISIKHAEAFRRHSDDLELVAVCDNDPAALKKAEAEYQVAGYTKLEEMIAKENLDAVSLCTPDRKSVV